MGSGIVGAYIHSVTCDPATSGVVYAGTDNGVFRSMNAGGSWTAMNGGLPGVARVMALAYDAAHPNVWFAGVWQSGVYLSADAGATWTPMLGGLGSINTNALAVDATRTTVYAGTDAGTFQFTNYPISVVAVEPRENRVPDFSCSPNPFHQSAIIRFAERSPGPVRVDVFDLSGRRVRKLLNQSRSPAGSSSVSWDGRDENGSKVADGVYLARLIGVSGCRCLRLAVVR